MKKEVLEKKWVHSHEEDTDTEMVFRPSDYNFPPSRGRQSFALSGDGTMVKGGIAPVDGIQESEGHWELEDNKLVLYPKSKAKPSKVMKIISAGPDKLVVAK